MKVLKKNQIMIYILVLILMVAGYLNYSSNTEKQVSLETSMQMEAKDDMQMADIGDATLVNSDYVTEQSSNSQENTIQTNNTQESSIEQDDAQDINEIEVKSEQTNNENNNTIETNSEETESDNDENKEYFIKSKLDRETMYSQMLETYEKVLNSTNSLETQKQSATEEIQKINNIKNSIMICENLLKTKGFDNSVIFVNNKSINVIIEAEELKQEEIAQIQNIISREMEAQIENIHITNK